MTIQAVRLLGVSGVFAHSWIMSRDDDPAPEGNASGGFDLALRFGYPFVSMIMNSWPWRFVETCIRA